MSWRPMRQCELNPALVRAHHQIGDAVPTEAWANDTYDCVVTRFPGGTAKLSIKRLDRHAIHDWRHLQQIKNEVCGPEIEAIELYPAESRLVDTANQYFLFALPPGVRLPIGFPEGLVKTPRETEAMNLRTGGKARQRPWEDGLTTGGQHGNGS